MASTRARLGRIASSTELHRRRARSSRSISPPRKQIAGLGPALPWRRELGLAVAAAFGVRTVGDFDGVGLSKRSARGAFARWDSMLSTPPCAAPALACVIAAA